MKTILLAIITLFILGSCGGNTNPEKQACTSTPSAIFSDTMRIVTSHTFEAEGQESTESIQLINGSKIEVLQSGCINLRQEFRITSKGKPLSDANYIAGSYLSLGELSLSSPALAGLEQYANIIAQNAQQVKLGQVFTPDPSLSIQIDKLENNGERTIIIALQGL